MVQMKVIRNDAQWFMTELYIPHGSDERIPSYRDQKLYVTFISHMVQMKVYCGCG